MKTLLISIFILSLTNVYATELSWVDEQIEAIKPPRKSSIIKNIKNPFVFLEKNGFVKKEPILEEKTVSTTNSNGKIITKVVKQRATPLVLNAILNHTALINGRWYKQNDKIRFYTITKIEKSTVILKNNNRQIILSTNIKKQTLKFRNK